MTEFTRLTVVGSARKAELVVPDDESLGGLIPRLMELLEEPAGPLARPLTLVRSTGEQLDAALSAAEQELADGEQLRLVRADDAPPPPEVADVTDVVGDSYGDRAGRWSATARHAIAAVTVGAAVCVALLVQPVSVTTGLALLVLLTAVATLLGRLGRRWADIALTAAAAGAAVPVARTVVLAAGARPGLLVWAAVAVVGIWVVLGFGVGVGLRSRPVVPAAVVGALLAGFPVLLAASGVAGGRAVTLGAAAAVVVCGVLPWYALAASGLTGLDDQVLAGRPDRRPRVLRTVDDAYGTLSWSTFAVALPLGTTAALLVSTDNRWSLLLGLAVITVTALRTRVFPLVVQQLPLCLAAVSATVVAALAHRPQLGVAGTAALLVALAVLVAVAAGVGLAPHQRARLRRLGNLLETITVIALPALVLGVFGIFHDLVGAFR